MKVNKYDFVMQAIYEFIDNKVTIGMHPQDIAHECEKDHRIELRLYDIDIDMRLELYRTLAEMAWYSKYSNMDFDRITIDKEKQWTNRS